jgi:hypothetical protein
MGKARSETPGAAQCCRARGTAAAGCRHAGDDLAAPRPAARHCSGVAAPVRCGCHRSGPGATFNGTRPGRRRFSTYTRPRVRPQQACRKFSSLFGLQRPHHLRHQLYDLVAFDARLSAGGSTPGNAHAQRGIGHFEHVRRACSVTMRTFAVMPGSRRPSRLAKLHGRHIGDHVVGRNGCLAHLVHPALKGLARKGVHREAAPSVQGWMRPTSVSSTLTSTRMSRRFCAITNSSGACRLAATVWPRSTVRLMTMPSTGDVMRVRERFVWACASAASRWLHAGACAACTCAAVTAAWAWAPRKRLGAGVAPGPARVRPRFAQ